MHAIIPAAGLGTRMAAVTGGSPKELLPLGNRTVLERVIDEALQADVDSIVVVSSPNKPLLTQAIQELAEGLFREANLQVAYQLDPVGLADAILSAGIEDDALILLGDCVYPSGSPVERMSNLIFRGIDGCIAVQTVSDAQVHLYGICEVNGMGTITKVTEKPKPEETESRWAVAARYACSASTMASFRESYQQLREAEPSGELSFTSLIQSAIKNGSEFKAVALQPGQLRVDCGTPQEYEVAMSKYRRDV